MTFVNFRLPLSYVLVALFSVSAQPSLAQNAQLRQAVAEAAAKDKTIMAFYKANEFDTIWTGRDRDDRMRRRALLAAFEAAGGSRVACFNL